MNRRKFIKFLSLAGGAKAFFGKLHPALAQTWQKLGPVTTIGARARLPQRLAWRKLPTISCGAYHTTVLRSDGLVFASGHNGGGQLGDNTIVAKSTFIQVVGISNAMALAGGGFGGNYHTMVLRSDGLVFSTGSNTKGQLGDNTTVDKSTFVQALGIINAVAVACGYNHTATLRSDGLVFTCGYNTNGRLGDNTSGAGTSKSTFIQAVGISNVVAVGCGNGHTVSLRSDGFVFSAGSNTYGQLGDDTVLAKSTFIQAVGISNAVAIAVGGDFTVALRSDGMVFSAGKNIHGQFGINSGVSKKTFIQAVGISHAVAVACGYAHTVALRSDGLVFACGYNIKGQLGNNTIVDKSTFIQVIGISNAVAVDCGQKHSMALISNGLIFTCGDNFGGKLGDNTTVSKSTFVQAIGI